ncbi:MAG: restriction endonuclease subunit S, partial [Epsilonproteobacteria bacterium]|nr:restriction endonuclease subunit S [Campylobacterota bacterium]
MSEIKQGYKQTKVGIIPQDWEVVKLGTVLKEKPKYGINAPAVEYSESLPTYLRITDIDSDGYFNPDKKASVNDKDYKNYILKENEIVFTRTGATVGKSYLYNKEDGELVYAGFLIKVAPNTKKLNSVFLKNFTNTHKYWNWIQLMSARSGQPGVNGEEYSIMPIPLPPLKEQEKIAEILTTWDEAITKQTELLEAKELLKKALMQKLLSGEVRFSGFSGE